MPDLDALYSALDNEVSVLKERFIAKFIPANPEHTPMDFEYDVKAFSILCHAAFEEYVEKVSEAMMNKIESDLKSKKTTLATACFVAAYGLQINISEDEDGADRTCFDHIRGAIADAKIRHSKALKDNHGVSAKYIRKLLIPVGINMPAGPAMASLKKLAEARGSYAHTMAKLAYYGDYKRTTKVLTPEEAGEAADDCLAICEDIRKRAKAIW